MIIFFIERENILNLVSSDLNKFRDFPIFIVKSKLSDRGGGVTGKELKNKSEFNIIKVNNFVLELKVGDAYAQCSKVFFFE
jgi:hypothetical protein